MLGENVVARTKNFISHTHTHRTTAIPSLFACGGEGNNIFSDHSYTYRHTETRFSDYNGWMQSIKQSYDI